jgi:hypothetical protein
MLLTAAEQLTHAATWEETMYESFPAGTIGDDTLHPEISTKAITKDVLANIRRAGEMPIVVVARSFIFGP